MHVRLLTTFGFAGVLIGQAAPAGDADLAARAAAVHERTFTLDAHIDTAAYSLRRKGWDFGQRHDVKIDFSQCDLPRIKQGGLDAAFYAAYVIQYDRSPRGLAAARDRALRMFLQLHHTAARYPEQLEIAYTADDGPRIAAKGKHAMYLSIENGYAIGKDLSLLSTFAGMGLRVFGLVHNGNNDLCDSIVDSKGPEWQGISPLGLEAIKECNRLGIVLDGSHMSDIAFRRLLQVSETPVILSHTGMRLVYDNSRNIGDDLLQALATQGGVINMNTLFVAGTPRNPERNAAMAKLNAAYAGRLLTDQEEVAMRLKFFEIGRDYPGQRPTFADFMRHLLHAIKVAGVNHVGIGTDFDGGGGVEGLEDVSDMPKITEALLKAGFSDSDIAKIWGGNLMRVLRQAEQYTKDNSIDLVQPLATRPGSTQR